jgi:uncharacterized protein (TIGR00730 family)
MARVCVFCSSSELIDPVHRDLARDVGAELARRGHDLVSGGGRVSMMGAVARAVRAGGGHTLGVIPQALVGLEVADVDADELVVTAGMRERKGLMDAAADAFLALPGGIGTLEELLEVWVAGTLGLHAKPVVVLDPDGVLAGLRDLVDALVGQGFVRPGAASTAVWTTTVGQALDAVEAGIEVARRGGLRSAPLPAELLEADVPAAELPVAELPVAELPVAELPVAELPVAELPAAELPAAELPAAELPAAELPAAELPAADRPAADVLPGEA